MLQIIIRANETIIKNLTISDEKAQAIIPVNGMLPHKVSTAQVSAVNEIGHGPASSLHTITIDPSITSMYEKSIRGTSFGSSRSEVGYTWLIIFLISLALMLIVLSALLVSYRRCHGNLKQKSNGYLAANTTESFHSQINNNGTSIINGGNVSGNISSIMNTSTLSSGEHGELNSFFISLSETNYFSSSLK